MQAPEEDLLLPGAVPKHARGDEEGKEAPAKLGESLSGGWGNGHEQPAAGAVCRPARCAAPLGTRR
jgi:hypothetical protein